MVKLGNQLKPRKINMEPENHPWKKKIILQFTIFRFYINLRGCIKNGAWTSRDSQQIRFLASQIARNLGNNERNMEILQFDPRHCGSGISINRASSGKQRKGTEKHVHLRKLTCPLKRDDFNRKYIFQPLIFRGHVSFQGSKILLSISEVCDDFRVFPLHGKQTKKLIWSIM